MLIDPTGTALEWAKALRAMTDVLGLSTIVTLYQAGNGIYELFDKVLVLDEGKEIFYGPMKDARPFMEGLGFVCEDAANTSDFLTGVTVPTERQIIPGHENTFPKTATDIRQAYENTSLISEMKKDYDYPTRPAPVAQTDDFKTAVSHDKHESLPKNSPLTASFTTQIRACIIRQYQILWGDKSTFIIKQTASLVQALVVGSLFYNAPNNTEGLFLKGGSLFFALLYNSLVAMSEVTDSFTGRPVLAKHKAFAFYHPAAFCIAQIATDIPVLIFQVSIFSVVLYFLSALKIDAGAFFTYWIVTLSVTMSITAMVRT